MRRDDRDDRDDPFEDLFRQLERMMNEMMGEGNIDVEGVSPGGTDFGGDTHVDVHRTDDDVRVVADLPGVEKEAIDLTCDGEVLTISAGSGHRDVQQRRPRGRLRPARGLRRHRPRLTSPAVVAATRYPVPARVRTSSANRS